MFTKLSRAIIHARVKFVLVRPVGQVLQLFGDASSNRTYPHFNFAMKRCAALNSKLGVNSKLGAALERLHPYRDGIMAYRLRIAEIAKLSALCGLCIIRRSCEFNTNNKSAPWCWGAKAQWIYI
jgi:hypothetical protein